MVKFASDGTSFWQFQTLRSGCNFLLLILAPLLLSIKLSILRPLNIAMVAWRTVFLILCMFCFFCAAPTLTFAQMAIGLYTYPIFVVIFAIFLLKEKITYLKLISLSLGILGAGLVLKPWSSDFSELQIFPVLAGFFYACNLFILRKHCVNESPLAMTFAVAIGFMISGLLGGYVVDNFIVDEAFKAKVPFIAVGWPDLTNLTVVFVVIASLFNLSGNLCLVKAYQTSESSFLAPLDYLYLIFALFWGKVMFDTFPDSIGLLGVFLIILSGVTVALQASKARKNVTLE